MKEFYLPIEEREENLDRACDIAQYEASEGPAYTDFMDVPLVALPGEGSGSIRDNWRKLFEQFTADKPSCPLCHTLRESEVESESAAPEPETPAKLWHDKWWGSALRIVFGIFTAFTLVRAVEGWQDDWTEAHPKPQSTTSAALVGTNSTAVLFNTFSTSDVLHYDGYTDAITINADEWKKLYGCPDTSYLYFRLNRTLSPTNTITLYPECGAGLTVPSDN